MQSFAQKLKLQAASAGLLMVDIEEAPSMSVPASVGPLGNYAVQIQWEDGFNQARSTLACPLPCESLSCLQTLTWSTK